MWHGSCPGDWHDFCCLFLPERRDLYWMGSEHRAPVCILREVDALYELIDCASDVGGWNPSEPRIHVQDLAPRQRPGQRIKLRAQIVTYFAFVSMCTSTHTHTHTQTHIYMCGLT